MQAAKWKKTDSQTMHSVIQKIIELRCNYCDILVHILDKWSKITDGLIALDSSFPVNVENMGNGRLAIVVTCKDHGVSLFIRQNQSIILDRISKTLKRHPQKNIDSEIEKIILKINPAI